MKDEHTPPSETGPALVVLGGLGIAGLLYWMFKQKSTGKEGGSGTTGTGTGTTGTGTTGTGTTGTGTTETGTTGTGTTGTGTAEPDVPEGGNMPGSTRPPIPQSIASQNIGQAGVSPEGYRLFTKTPVPDAITQKCKELLGLASGFSTKEFGYEEYATIDGKNYFFRIEPHYHPDDYPGGPHGWHKGCTVYEKLDIVVDQ